MPWEPLTNLGDSNILLPLAAILYVWLRWNGAAALASSWLAWMGFALFLVLATKLAYLCWGIGIPSIKFEGISDHSMLASSVYPSFVFVLMGSSPRWPQKLAVFTSVILAGLIVASRVILHYHSVSEAMIGAGLGGFVSFRFMSFPNPPQQPHARRALFGFLSFSLLLLNWGLATPGLGQVWLVDFSRFVSRDNGSNYRLNALKFLGKFEL